MSELAELLQRQAGVVRLDQARAAGLSARAIQHRATAGRWTRVHPGVYLAEGARLGTEARVRAAWLWAGDESTLTGLAAAWWHGLRPDLRGPVDLVLPRSRHPRPQPGLRLHRRDLDPEDCGLLRGLAVTGLPLTVLDTTLALGRDGSTFLDRALQKHVSHAALLAAHRRRRGRVGNAELDRLLRAAADRAASAAERLLLRILREADITGWTLDHPYGDYGVDLVFLAERVAIETDGWAWHSDPERFRRDRRKGNALTTGDWRLLRYTWHDLDREPARVVAEIRSLLKRRAA
jgi:very-short-patch-repair endonuclease